MKVEDKKYLAKWMGGYFSPVSKWTFEFVRTKDGREITQWNPDVNHIQFKEIWAKLPNILKLQVVKMLIPDCESRWIVGLDFIDMALNTLPKIMDTALTAIRNES